MGHFFSLIILVICGFLVWSDSVRTAAAVAIMYLVPFYSRRTPDERFRALSSPLLCFFVDLFSFFLCVGETDDDGNVMLPKKV